MTEELSAQQIKERYDSNKNGVLNDDELLKITQGIADNKISIDNMGDYYALSADLAKTTVCNVISDEDVEKLANGIAKQIYSESKTLKKAFPNGVEAKLDIDEFCGKAHAPLTPAPQTPPTGKVLRT